MATKVDPGMLICVGVVTGARGIKGDIRVKSFTADPEDLGSYGPLLDAEGAAVFKVKVTGVAKGQLIARIKGIDDRTAAEQLKGVKFYVRKEALPEPEEDEFYFSDLIGLRAELEDGSDFGTVTAVENFGAGDVLEISGHVKGGIMVPFTNDVVPVVDLAGNRVVICPPDGLMEPPDEEAKG
jgi:16S rRNA processing protein RimM